MKIIAAVDSNWGIGKNNKIPWKCAADMRYFRRATLEGNVIMGRKTWESLGRRNLPQRRSIIISSSFNNETYTDGIHQYFGVNSVYRAQQVALDFEKHFGGESWVIGGAEIYSQFLDYCTEAHITHIDGKYNCDTFFPYSIFESTWTPVSGISLEENCNLVIYKPKKTINTEIDFNDETFIWQGQKGI